MRACLTVLLGVTLVWATAFFSGVAYLGPPGSTTLDAAVSALQGAVVDVSGGAATAAKAQQAGERYRVERTEWERQEEARDGYLITSDSPLIRDRVRAACGRNAVGQVSWQQTYIALHRNTLALRRRINAAAERHKEEMDMMTRLPLTPDTLRLANAVGKAKEAEQDFEHYGTDHDTAAAETEATITMDQERYLVYSCLLGQHCGGWGDRMYGVMNAFFVALITDRTFLIDWELPPPIEADQEKLPRQRSSRASDASTSSSAATTAELVDAARRTYIEMVNAVKREMELVEEQTPSTSSRKRLLSIARVLEPTNIDWRFTKKLLAPLLKKQNVTYIDTVEMHASVWKGKPLSEVDIEQEMFGNRKVVIWRTNNWYVNAISGNPLYRDKIIKYFGVDPKSFADMASLQQWTAQLYGCFVNFLFRPVAPIRSIVAAHAERMHRGGFTLGVQLRMGGSNVRWSDPQRNDEGDIPLFFRCARDLLLAANGTEPVAKPIGTYEVPKKGESPWQVFVMTDSDDVKKRLKSKFHSKAITVDLPISHIERQNVGFESYVTIAVEAWLLGECDFILSSRSNLGWFAAKRTMHDFGTYVSPEKECFYNRGIYAMAPAFSYSSSA